MGSADAKEQVQELIEMPKSFLKEGMHFINRCKKPDQKEFIRITQAVAMGFAALGALGYFVKLIHIPINNILLCITMSMGNMLGTVLPSVAGEQSPNNQQLMTIKLRYYSYSLNHMESQLIELLEFLHQPSPQVRAVALEHVLGYTPEKSEYRQVLIDRHDTVCKDLVALCREDMIVIHNALKALINLSSSEIIRKDLDDVDFINYLCHLIINPKFILADVACMLLSNMTQYKPIGAKIMKLETKPTQELCQSTRLIDHLVEVFHRGHKKSFNANANYDFLSSVFANLSGLLLDRRYFLEPAPHDGLVPLTKLQIFTEDPSVIRRGSVITTIKNCCFERSMHVSLLDAEKLNTLPFILLPLCGSEEYDMDEFEHFPEEIQLLGDDKQREPDHVLRSLLTETLLLLTSSRQGREILREKQVYRVIQRLHAQETNEEVKETCESIVDMLIREEVPLEETPRLTEIDDEDDEDMQIEEIV